MYCICFQDFTHSLLATAKLAAFHAVSYCMREDEEVDFLDKYPFLNEDPVYRPSTKKLFTRAQNSLAKRMHNIFLQQNEVSGHSKTMLTRLCVKSISSNA